MDLRLGHNFNEGPHQACGFTLTNERRSRRNDGFRTRHVHSLEEEPRKVLDDPLHDAEVIQHLHRCIEEYYSGELR